MCGSPPRIHDIHVYTPDRNKRTVSYGVRGVSAGWDWDVIININVCTDMSLQIADLT